MTFLSIGPVDLTQRTLSPDSSSLIPTVTDNAFSLGLIAGNQISISFEPTTSIEALNGELSWGGVDTSKFTGTIAYTATGAVVDGTTGLLRITSSQFSNLQSLFFTINGATFEFTANAQLWPRSLNTALGGSASSIYLIVADNGVNTGSGLDFINGYTQSEESRIQTRRS
ncbi:hypothetical protein C0992_001401 [Termitomyces sp. T32_za158]|nr:hypothetical protein C0992_001401 [Termitomyces sp. T32_za158]